MWSATPVPPTRITMSAPAQLALTPPRKQAAAATVLGRVLGEGLLAAIHEGFLKGDLAGAVLLLAADSAEPHLRTATQAVFVDACDAGEEDVVRLLLGCDGVDGNAAVDPDYDVEEGDYLDMEGGDEEADSVLTSAARNGRAGVVRALVESGKVDVNRRAPNGELPLMQAVRSGGAACLDALLAAAGVETSVVDGDGYTALMVAAEACEDGSLRRLLAVDGVAVNHADDGGDTALILAAANGSAGGVRALLGVAGIDFNHANEYGGTALDGAAVNGHAACVRALLEMEGIDVNRVGHQHRTVLLGTVMRAVDPGWEGCARALASAKNIDLNDRHAPTGKTALHFVCSKKNAALASHLLIAGGCRFIRARTTRGPRLRTAGARSTAPRVTRR